MKFKTLQVIEKLLQEDLMVKEHELKVARERVRELRKEQDNEDENFTDEELEYWEDSRNFHFDRVTDAKNALDDFLEHDWR